ncbi:hypothetical protein U2075_14680, partial [Listeria monocytogenes]|uniref:hypothetical protein n=1 Tax=Listeria monocytogenes TaxID=1639 RepID=UPI002FDC5BB3
AVNRILDDNAVEAQRFEATDASLTCDIWPLTDRDGATGLRNVGTGTALPGVVVAPARSGSSTSLDGGAYSLGTPDQGLAASGMVDLRPANR